MGQSPKGPYRLSAASGAQVFKWLIIVVLIAIAIALLARRSGKDPSKETDAQLGLNAQQAAGRAIFNADCATCHYAYSSSGSKGPGLRDLFRKKYLPSGLPANDRFVEQTIVNGRGMMPAQSAALTEQQLADLLAYLHTL
ncbi:MAG: cytochrome c [Acidobacteriota bacterium]|nr:cytochrome c [Acidobacteriota bacterium]